MIRIIFIHLPFLSEKIWATKFFPIYKASNHSNPHVQPLKLSLQPQVILETFLH